MDKASTSTNIADEIVLNSDSDLDDDEIIDVSDDVSSSDEIVKKGKEDDDKEKNKEEEANGEEGDDEEDEDEDEGEGGSGSESLESEEDEDESEEDEDESEEEEEEDGDDSVWDSFDEENVIQPSQEANEAAVLRDFHVGLDDMLAGRRKMARKAFEKVLQNPMVSCFHQENIKWEVEHDDKLSKMARLFVGCHKNLVSLDKDNQMGHLLQVLSLSPNNNSSLWLDLGLCSLEKGDPSLAKYAFKRAESDEGYDALISVFYLTGEYHACLEYIKMDMDKGHSNKKFVYLKEKIRSINDHFREYHDDLFQEDRHFSEFQVPLTEQDKREMEERLRIAEEKYSRPREELKPQSYEPTEVDIDFEQGLQTVCTLFCDLYDRIECYSNLARQKIHFRRWDNHQIYLDSVEAVEDIISILEVTECLLAAVEEREEEEEDSTSMARNLLADRRKSARMMERWGATPDTANSMPPSVEEPQHSLPSTEISIRLKFQCPYVLPLFNPAHSTRAPTPVGPLESVSETFLLSLIRQELMDRSWVIRDIIDVILLNLAEVCPVMGALPKHLREVMIQLYRRLNRMCSDLNEEKYLKLHVLMDDLGDEQGRDYATRWHHGEFEWPDRWLALRYAWNCARSFTTENTKLEYLDLIEGALDENEVLMTGNGGISLHDVYLLREKVAKVERVRSIKLYGDFNMHEEVVKIMCSDIEFSTLEEAEVPVMLNYWFNSLFATERYEEATDLLCRVISHYLSNETELNGMLPRIMGWCSKIQLDSVSIIALSSLGFFFCHLVDKKQTYWMYWKKLHEIVRAIEGPVSTAYISTLTASSHDDALPLLSLELLMKAHEALGPTGHCTTENNGEFIIFMIEELAKIYENEELLKILMRKENAWILCNADEEIAQCLHCAFGRFSKRRKQMNDHHHRPAVTPSSELAAPVLTLAMPRPLPLFEDKERLGHDVPELILSKFPEVIEVSEERKTTLEEFKKWLKATKKEEINDGLVWPVVGTLESELQASIWYVMALSSYRQNSMEENKIYCQLFLTSGRATKSNPATTSAWGMLAHTMICELFKLDEDQMFRQWEYRTMPYRMGIHIDESLGLLHFQLANSLYQTATVFKRHMERIPADHYLHRHRSLITKLREEAKRHFELCVQLPPVDNKVEEYQWLSFFFLAKLHAKAEEIDTVKVVDHFFEAACSCELGDFFWYPLKINLKKQANLEPVELHYQLHNAIWKYLRDTPDPDEDTLLALLSYARAFRYHKVVKSSNSLFRSSPEIHDVVLRMCVQVDRDIVSGEDIELMLNTTLNIVDLVDELWNMCYKAFELVYERFPHHKAAHRLAEMELDKKNYPKALEQLLKGVFRRRKKEDGFFDNFIDISSADITRSGSYEFHVERSTALLLRVLLLEKDLPSMLQLLQTLVTLLGENDETHISGPMRHTFLRIILQILDKSLTAAPHSPKHYTTEIVRIWQKMEKYRNCAQMSTFKGLFQKIVQPKVGDLGKLLEQQNLRDEMAKKPGRKRKMLMADVDSQPKKTASVGMAPSVPPQLPASTLQAVQLLVQSALIQSISP